MPSPDARHLLFEAGFRKRPVPFMVLAGAGISYDAPSCVPLANELTWSVLQALLPSDQTTDAMRERYLGLKGFGIAAPRLETVLECAVEVFGVDVLKMFEPLAHRKANRNHHLLARMSDLGPVITTNIDGCIEAAKGGPPYRVVANQDPPEGGAVPPLLKIHGSADLASEQLAVTLSAMRHGYADYLEHAMSGLTWEIGGDLIVCGYSGLDTCDLWRFLRRRILKSMAMGLSKAHIYWIEHDSGLSVPACPSLNYGQHLFAQTVEAGAFHYLRGPTYDYLHAAASILSEFMEPGPYEEAGAARVEAPVLAPFDAPESVRRSFQLRLLEDIGLFRDCLSASAQADGPDVAHFRRSAACKLGLAQYAEPIDVQDFNRRYTPVRSLATIAHLNRCSGGLVTVDCERITAQLHEMVTRTKYERVDPLRSREDLDAIFLVSTSIAEKCDALFSLRGKAISRETLAQIYAAHDRRHEILEVAVPVMAAAGSRLLATPEGVAMCARLAYLRDIGIVVEDDFDAYAGIEGKLDLAESTLVVSQNDVFWSALYQSDLLSALDSVALHIESYLVWLASGRARDDQVSSIWGHLPVLLRYMDELCAFTRNVYYAEQFWRYCKCVSLAAGAVVDPDTIDEQWRQVLSMHEENLGLLRAAGGLAVRDPSS